MPYINYEKRPKFHVTITLGTRLKTDEFHQDQQVVSQRCYMTHCTFSTNRKYSTYHSQFFFQSIFCCFFFILFYPQSILSGEKYLLSSNAHVNPVPCCASIETITKNLALKTCKLILS